MKKTQLFKEIWSPKYKETQRILIAFKENRFSIKTCNLMLKVHDQENPEIQQEESIKS